jgi:transcription elongation factor GreA
MNLYYCTPEGYNQIRVKLEKLRKVDRKEIVQYMNEIAKEQGAGALGESVEYIHANDELNKLERNISILNDKINNSKVIDISKIPKNGKIVFGSTVTLFDLDKKEELVYKIVGEDEADIKCFKISLNSPIARALIGKTIDDEIEIDTPRGERFLEVLKIEHI